MIRNARLAALACAAAALAAHPAHAQEPLTHAPRPTAGAISAQDLRTRLYVFADDSMMGREAGTRGNAMGTAYIASELRRLGLQPAGENGGYFQDVPMVQRGLAPGATLTVDGQSYAVGTDFLAVPRYGQILQFAPAFSASGVQAVYGGRVGDPSTMISPEQARGKLVVFAAPMGQNGQPTFAFWAAGRTYAQYADAAGVAFATLDLTGQGLRGFLSNERTELKGAEQAPARLPAGLIISNAAAERILGAPLASLQVGAAGKTVTGAFTFFERPTPHPVRNVIAVLPGSDPAMRGQYVAIGAHPDHVGTEHDAVEHDSVKVLHRLFRPEGADQPGIDADTLSAPQKARFRAALDSVRARRPARVDSIYNGADDDGSGSMGVLEIAEHFVSLRHKPRRSILFVWHNAEELGLLGSEHFAAHPTVPLDSIVAQLNIDMIGRGAAGDTEGGGPGYLQLVGSRRLSTQLGDLVESVNTSGRHGFAFDYSMDANGHPQNIYCRSDHANYAKHGIPVTFFTTGGHSDYHQLTDEPQYIAYDKLAAISSFIGAVGLEIANRNARLVVDKPIPDPNAPCRQ
ncbi:M28 family metallopeptidase [Longimicrobium sp.]|uniref:M28 family metallopeptidase n=1 Tax=Longimicrobium sp. TaxID=2029185 RepID=UPI002ED9179D